MKSMISALALAAALGVSGMAAAQPSGGPAAKGNAPLKAPHTVNDGMPKHGHNSFTEGQARKHIEKAGFTGVTGLVKGDDGVWRGQAMKGGQTVDVAMDFKGNVTTSGGGAMRGGPPPRAMARPAPAMGAAPMTPAAAPAAAPAGGEGGAMSATTTTTASTSSTHHMRTHHHRRHAMNRCANPTPNGAACSGVDKNDNGISDKEDRALGHS